MKCPNCGNELADGARFCTRCGMQLKNAAASKSVKMQSDNNGETSKAESSENINSFEIHKNKFVWKQQYTYAVFVVAVIIAVVAGMMVRASKSNTKNDYHTENVVESAAVESKENENVAASESDTESEVETSIDETKESTIEKTEEADPEPEAVVETDTFTEVTMNNVISVQATSSLSEHDMTHDANRIMDGDLTKAWVEGADGDGIGENITFILDGTYKISGISISAGYQKTSELYAKNSRPKDITIEFSDGGQCQYCLDDTYSNQIILFDEPVNSETIKIIIDSVYPGTTYTDTCISEISLF